MTDDLVARISEFVNSDTKVKHPPVSTDVVDYVSAVLEVEFPELLTACYTKVANGGFGPGFGLIGLGGSGATSQFGTLIETHSQLSSDIVAMGADWPEDLLPYCYWGGNYYSCVDCDEHCVWTFEDCELWPEDYDLPAFFEMWLNQKWPEYSS